VTERTADLDAWRCLIDGRAMLDRGRHADAARAFRTACGMFERRDDQLHAGMACYELGLLVVQRGAIEDACRFFTQAGRKFREAGAIDRAIAAAAAEGSARIEAGELDVAEALLQTAQLAGVELGACQELLMVRAALIRCLHLQGRFDDALRLIEREDAGRRAQDEAARSDVAPLHQTQWHCAAGAVAVHRRTFEEASSHVTAALSAAKEGPPLATCAAHRLAVRLQGLIGDAEAIERHAASALEAARVARAPIEALRLRVTLVGALNEIGSTREARAAAARLLRRRARRIPPLLAAERGIALARALHDSAAARALGEEGEKFARTSGAAALLEEATSAPGLPRPLDDVVDLLRRTHEYEDEDGLLSQVAGFLRDRLGALGIAFYSAEDLDRPIVSAGSGRGVAVARAVRAGLILGPLRTCAGIEMAAPLRCGGATIGGVGCRWSAAGPTAAEHARTLLATAAAMCGPFFQTVLDRRRAAPMATGCPELLGASQAMIDLRHAIARAALAPFPVLVVGESGVGKELVARAIHRESPRRLRNFAALNCAALTEDLVEAELFGHARGAFTGAIAERRGLFEEADGGTLFLDEVSELSPRAQAKLLRVLQEGEVRRVGESFARHIEVRVVAATNRSLEAAGTATAFRHDLRYRLDVIRIEVPPLRERLEDIPVLANAFWSRLAPLTECRARLSPSTLAALAYHDWPGNVRELQNVIAALSVSAPRRGLVGPSALPAVIARTAMVPPATRLEEARRAFERRCVGAALARAAGQTGRAAKELGISRQGLAKLMKRIGIVVANGNDGS
jgi:DNA-binding NtrC family response regulator